MSGSVLWNICRNNYKINTTNSFHGLNIEQDDENIKELHIIHLEDVGAEDRILFPLKNNLLLWRNLGVWLLTPSLRN